MDLGDQKAAAGDLAAALKAYQAADAIMGVPTTGIELARTQEKLGRLIEARDACIAVTRFPVAAREPAAFTKAREAAKRLAEELGARIPSLVLRISGPPPGTEIQANLDDKPLASDLVGLPIKINPGQHRVVAEASGFRPVERELDVAEGETKELSLVLSRAKASSAPETSAPRAVVAPAEKEPGPTRTLMWVGFGVGGAAVVTGAVTGVASLSATNRAKELCEDTRCPPEAQDDINSGTTLANISNVAFAVGAVGLGVGVWQLISTGKASSNQSAAARAAGVEPLIGLGRVGIAGRFE
jgi:hypothetical protein